MERDIYGDTSRQAGREHDVPPLRPGEFPGDGERERARLREQGSVVQLVRGLVGDVGELTRLEIELAKAEMNEKIDKIQAGAGLLGTGSVLALAGLVVLLMACVYALATQIPLWASAFVVGGIAVAIGVAVLFAGKAKIASGTNLVPHRAVHSVRADANAVSRSMQ